MPTESEHVLRCPSCGGKDIRRSHSRGTFDSVMLAIRRVPYRCRQCARRFYRYTSDRPEESMADGQTAHGKDN